MKQLVVRLAVTTAVLLVGISLNALDARDVSQAAADELSYPWCTQGGTLHCYYENRQQCEETVDYHGFCVSNPDYDQPLEKNGSHFQR